MNEYDYGARMYDPALGRWYTVDPKVEIMPEHSPYNYTLNNPVNYVDPDGEVPIPVITGAIGGVIGGVVAGGISAIRGGSWKNIGKAAAGGFVGGFIVGSGAGLITGTAGITTAGALGITATAGGLSGAATSLTMQGIEVATGERAGIDGMEVFTDALIGIPANLVGSSIANAATSQIKKEAAGQIAKVTQKAATKGFKNSIKRELRQNNMLSKKQVNRIAKETISVIKQNRTAEINAVRVTLQGATVVGVETVIQTTTNAVDERIQE